MLAPEASEPARPRPPVRGIVDLNVELGDGHGRWATGSDPELLAMVSSASVACGLHAGDPSMMRRTVAMAHESGVTLGAHVSYPVRQRSGPRAMSVSPSALADLVVYQVGALKGLAGCVGATIRYVKTHGHLYRRFSMDPDAASAVVRALQHLDGELAIVGLPGSCTLIEAKRIGLATVPEGFPSRGYDSRGELVARGSQGGIIEQPTEAARRALDMVLNKTVTTVDGDVIDLRVQTLGIREDADKALAVARSIRAALEREGVLVRSDWQPV